MEDRESLELEPGEYRQVPKTPLAPRKVLWQGVFWSGVAMIGGWYAAWQLDTWWAALLPIPGALWVGIALVGLFPNFWYGNSD